MGNFQGTGKPGSGVSATSAFSPDSTSIVVNFSACVSVSGPTGIEYQVNGGAWTQVTSVTKVSDIQYDFTVTSPTISPGDTVNWRYVGGSGTILDCAEANDIGDQQVPVNVPPVQPVVPIFARDYTLGSLNVDATFARASEATVTDFEGLIRTSLTNESRFEGLRRVENIFTQSISGGTSKWSTAHPDTYLAGGASVDETDPDNPVVSFTASAADSIRIRAEGTVIKSGQIIVARLKVQGSAGDQVRLTISNGVFDDLASTAITLDGSVQVITGTHTFSSDTADYQLWLRNSNVQPTVKTITLIDGGDWQLEEVTGQTNQNPSEYVSVGVESAPYHGANVDGVQYFNTQNGNTVTSNVVAEATGADLDVSAAGLLMEPASTNICNYSEDFADAEWSKTNTVITSNQATAPDGALTADRLEDNTSSLAHSITQSVGNSINGTHTTSIYAKDVNRRYFWMQAYGRAGASANRYTVVFDLVSGVVTDTNTIGTPTNTGENIEFTDSGYYRVSVTGDHDSSATMFVIMGLSDSGTPSYNANGYPTYTGDGSGVDIWGAQLEVQPVPTSYIKTEGAQISRDADTLFYPLTTPQTEGMAIIDGLLPQGRPLSPWTRWLGTRPNPNNTWLYSTNSNNLISNDGTNSTSASILAYSVGDSFTNAVRWESTTPEMGTGALQTIWRWDTALYGGAWLTDNEVHVFPQMPAPTITKSIEIFDVDQGQQWIEDNY